MKHRNFRATGTSRLYTARCLRKFLSRLPVSASSSKRAEETVNRNGSKIEYYLSASSSEALGREILMKGA